jgi:hypothetical protein
VTDLQLPIITGNPILDSIITLIISILIATLIGEIIKFFFTRQTEQKDYELKEHRQRLRVDIQNLSEGLHLRTNNNTTNPQWRKEVEILPITITLHQDLENHLKKSKFKIKQKGLVENIIELPKAIESHNEDVQKFVNGLRAQVESKFKENGIDATEFPNRGFYYVGEYQELLIYQLDNIVLSIKNNNNLNELKEKLNMHFNRNENGFATMMGKVVGNIEDAEIERMEKLLKDIPFDKALTDALRQLYKNVLAIREKANMITLELNRIIDLIERNHYREKAKCCPKRFHFF